MVNSRGQTFVIFCLLILQVIASTSSISDFNLEFTEGLEVKTSDTEQPTINSNSFFNDNCPYFLTMSEALDQGCANQVEECSDRLTPAEVVALRCTEAGASSLLKSHSLGVQRAFRLSSDLTKYTSEELLETKDWFVVTNLDESVHVYQFEGPDKIRPTLHDGFYIWSYEKPSIAKESLEEMYKSGLIEGFHPLIDMQAIPDFTPNDPLFANQWHLVNTAQIGGSAVAGEDVNITSVWDDYDGTGIIISIVDDGIESSHPDLSTNWNSVVSYDWCNSDSDPSHTSTAEYHGTAVAGVAAATGNNNIDVSGAAFGATISAQKIMGTPCNSGWTDGDVLGFSNTIIDIYQNSWGYSTPYVQTVTTPVESGIESSITNGRGGLGSIIVFSAGNDLAEGSNSNNGDLPNSRYTIAVSAITDSGEQSPYSEPGTNILLAAYSDGGQIGILTTDPTGTNGKPGMNSTYGNFGGTSSAAPLVSGIIALMLEANENLTWRDVQHILVNSAKKNDANDSSWIINGAGHDVSEKFGFGAIDAGAAVNKALNWQSVDIEDTSSYGPFTTVKTIADPTSLCQTTVYSTSSDSDGDGYEDEECTFNLPSGETLELDLRLPDIHANEVGVKLTGPSGTQTIWQPGDFVNTNTSWPMQSQNNTLLNARLINLGSYTTSGTYTLQIYDSYGDGCPGYSAFTYQISCEIFATYGSDWTESTVTISGGINYLETVELEVDIDHTNRSNLDIVLVSPSGTESWLAKKYHDGNGENDLNWKFSSVHHWDEYSDGTWTLKIRDVVSGDTGTLNSWSLNIYGTNNSQNSCLAGTYQPTGQSSCIDASAGYYVDTSGSTMQTACAAGTFQPSTGQSSCIASYPGYYVASSGSASQTVCAAGTYQPSSEQTSCIQASVGHYVDVNASISQIACPAGTYQPLIGQSSCINASAGYYAHKEPIALDLGDQHTCSILYDGSLKCWGYNPSGQLGDGTNTIRNTPTLVSLPAGRTAVSVSLGGGVSCAILDDGALYCWGGNTYGALGDGTNTARSTPTLVNLPEGRTAVSVSVGGGHSCAILDNSSLYCWGSNSNGQLGDGGANHQYNPTSVNLPTGRSATSVAAGNSLTCAILDSGQIYCWGLNSYGQFGDGTTTSSSIPISTNLPSGRTAKTLQLGSSNTCAILDDDSLYCWGSNTHGQIGDGTQISRNTPTSVNLPNGRTAVSVSLGGGHSCAILDDFSLYCWGRNNYGQLGDGTQVSINTPSSVNIPVGRTAVDIALGTYHSCSLLDNESMYCWGNNVNGILGIGTNTGSFSSPGNVSQKLGMAATLQTPCASGSYQPSIGQISCIDASVGYYTSATYSFSGDFEDGTIAGMWQTSSLATYPMTADSGSPISGSYSAMSTNQGVGASASGVVLSITNMVNDTDTDGDGIADKASYSFAYSVSSESGWDFLVFCIDNDANCQRSSGYQMRWSGLNSGVYTGTVDAGAHTFTWNYWKDNVVNGFTDTAWIDDITMSVFTSTTQTACATGTYQPSTGQSSCIDASAGYYVPSTGSATQTACAAGTYQPSTGQESCIDASAGYYVASTGSTSQATCAAGTYQPSTGQESCIDASAGYYVDSIGSTTQTACAAGTYNSNTASTSSSACTDASAGYYVPSTGSATQTICATGTYQPSTGQSSCIDASAGYYVSSTGSATQTICAAGTYQPSTGQSSCIDASAGYYVDTTGSTTQTVCAAGTYQPSTGQSSCIDASAGYYVDSIGSTTQTACAAGTYNSNTASTSSSACTDASAGYHVPSAGSATQTACAVGTYQSLIGQSSCIAASTGHYVNTTASTSQTACAAGTYQPSTGQTSCIDASAGYYVDSTGSATQTACTVGTYQPSTGQSSCIDASAGYYVDSTGSTTQISCSTGTYQPSTGQSSCIDASAGYYVPSTGSATQTACAAGTYQPSTGQSSCIDADPGYFVPISGSANQTACAVGTYQPSSGQSSCIDASPGNYVDTNASIVQNPCIHGTYQPSSGQSSCLDSDAGYYVATSGSVDQTPCDVGTFQELEGQVSCVDASAGYYVNTTASTTQIACPLGSYQPLTGQTSCLLATPGHYVPLNGSSTQTPCLAGTYNPLNGSFSQGDCIQASTGHHVPNEGSASQIECLAGYFQNITGQSSCNPAGPGYFVPNNASWFQVGCTYGTYQPNSGQVNCLDASPGHYVSGFASSTQTECALGSYQPQSGETSCISASIGYYVDQSASTNQTSCPPGTSTTSIGSVSINDCYTDTDSDGIPDIIDPDDDNDGYLDDLDAFPLDPTEWFDTDNDGIGNNADLDDDNDGWSDITEIDCGDSDPLNGTSTPADYDEDGICNTLDEDDDNDSYPDSNDDFPLDYCAIIDTDGDGIPDWVFINCNTNLSEDIDDDNDGYNDTNDSHPLDPSEWFDTDNDGIGNNADTDDDGDNVPDQFDVFPLDSTEWMDTDGDGVGDNADTDNDGDGVLDTNDDFPNDANETTDTDGDGIGNNADDDDDGDGYLDIYDQFPLDSTEWFDTDLDGIGNNADPDDDGDGWTDNDEFICGSDELDANDVPDDSDGDGICDSEDDDSTGLGVIVDVISNPLVVGLFLLTGAIILVTLFLQSRNQSSRINELEGMLANKTIIEDDELSND